MLSVTIQGLSFTSAEIEQAQPTISCGSVRYRCTSAQGERISFTINDLLTSVESTPSLRPLIGSVRMLKTRGEEVFAAKASCTDYLLSLLWALGAWLARCWGRKSDETRLKTLEAEYRLPAKPVPLPPPPAVGTSASAVSPAPASTPAPSTSPPQPPAPVLSLEEQAAAREAAVRAKFQPPDGSVPILDKVITQEEFEIVGFLPMILGDEACTKLLRANFPASTTDTVVAANLQSLLWPPPYNPRYRLPDCATSTEYLIANINHLFVKENEKWQLVPHWAQWLMTLKEEAHKKILNALAQAGQWELILPLIERISAFVWDGATVYARVAYGDTHSLQYEAYKFESLWELIGGKISGRHSTLPAVKTQPPIEFVHATLSFLLPSDFSRHLFEIFSKNSDFEAFIDYLVATTPPEQRLHCINCLLQQSYNDHSARIYVLNAFKIQPSDLTSDKKDDKYATNVLLMGLYHIQGMEHQPLDTIVLEQWIEKIPRYGSEILYLNTLLRGMSSLQTKVWLQALDRIYTRKAEDSAIDRANKDLLLRQYGEHIVSIGKCIIGNHPDRRGIFFEFYWTVKCAIFSIAALPSQNHLMGEGAIQHSVEGSCDLPSTEVILSTAVDAPIEFVPVAPFTQKREPGKFSNRWLFVLLKQGKSVGEGFSSTQAIQLLEAHPPYCYMHASKDLWEALSDNKSSTMPEVLTVPIFTERRIALLQPHFGWVTPISKLVVSFLLRPPQVAPSAPDDSMP